MDSLTSTILNWFDILFLSQMIWLSLGFELTFNVEMIWSKFPDVRNPNLEFSFLLEIDMKSIVNLDPHGIIPEVVGFKHGLVILIHPVTEGSHHRVIVQFNQGLEISILFCSCVGFKN